MKKLLAILFLALTTVSSHAQTAGAQRLFETIEGRVPYRIPAIATCSDGTLIAVADYRYCGGDIG
jgi:sialidase-1